MAGPVPPLLTRTSFENLLLLLQLWRARRPCSSWRRNVVSFYRLLPTVPKPSSQVQEAILKRLSSVKQEEVSWRVKLVVSQEALKEMSSTMPARRGGVKQGSFSVAFPAFSLLMLSN